MTSLMTNVAAIAALDTLRTINRSMEATQARVSSGFRIENASDNAAYWSIATTMRSDNKALSAVEDALSLGAATVNTAYTGMDGAIEIVDEIKAKLVAAREPGVDKGKINKELTELKNQIRSIAESSSFNGENWLIASAGQATTYALAKTVVGSFNRAADGTVSISTLNYDPNPASTGSRYLIDDLNGGDEGILTSDGYALAIGASQLWALVLSTSPGVHQNEISLSSTTTNAELDEMIVVVDMMMSDMIDAAAELGALNSRIGIQSDFIADLRDTIERGIGRLVDADMNDESTRLKALETQLQLGIQALSLSNSSTQSILQLFG